MSRENAIELKLIIDGKDAVAQVNLTDEAVKKLSANLRGVCNDAEITGDAFVDGFTRARNTIQGMREVWEGTKQIFGKPLELSVQYEQYEAAMEVMLKSADAAKNRMKELEAFAAATPFQLAEVVQLGMQLQSVQQYSMETVKTLGDLAAASGKSMAQVFGAYAKLATGQIGEAKRMFQDVLISEKDWEKALNEKGLAETADNMMTVLDDILVEKGMAGMMDKMSERMVGKLSNFEDAVSRMQKALGDGIAGGIAPFIDSMTKGMNVLNEFSPALAGVIYGMGTMTVSASFLNTTGLLPMIMNKQKLIQSLQSARLQFHLASMSGQQFAGSMTAASVATKGFFASLGPVGWAAIGIGLLTTAIGALSSQTEKAQRDSQEFSLSISQMNLEELKNELDRQKALVDQSVKRLAMLRNEYEFIQKTGLTGLRGDNALLDVKREIRDEQDTLFVLTGRQYEVETAIEKTLENQEKLRKQQAATLRKQLDVDLLKSDKERQLKALEQQYEEKKNIANKDQSLLADIEKWYALERNRIVASANKNSINEQMQYHDKLNSLRLQAMKDGLDKELKALEFWYEEQKRVIRKNNIDLLNQARQAKEKEIREKYSDKSIEETLSRTERIMEIEKKSESDILQKKIDIIKTAIQTYNQTANEQTRISKEMYDELLLQLREYNNQYEAANNERTAKETAGAINLAKTKLEAARLEKLKTAESINNEYDKSNIIEQIEENYLNEKIRILQDELEAVKTNINLEVEERIQKENELLVEIAGVEMNLIKLKKSASENSIALAKREMEMRRQYAMQFLSESANIFGQIYQRSQSNARSEIETERKKRSAQLESERKKRLEHAVTKQEEARINEEFDRRQERLDAQMQAKQKKAGMEMFNIQKGLNVAKTMMETYLAATAALTPPPTGLGPVAGVPYAAVITAMGLANVALIASQQPPGYTKGGLIYGYGGPYDDANLIRVSHGEYVINADSTSRYLNILDAINNDRELMIPTSQQRDSELVSELRLMRYENKRLMEQQTKSFSRFQKINANIDKYATAAIVETAETLIGRSKA